jgi:uncharacterized protein
MRYTWDDVKRQSNLQKHGLDFADAEKVFAQPVVLFEDDRADYGETRMIGIGMLDFLVVLIVHVESDEEIRIISMRKAGSDETDLYYKNTGYF